jgi:1-acyl-sn-glycerol-3-phosphate acyltransferase
MKWILYIFSVLAIILFIGCVLLIAPFSLCCVFFGKIRGGNMLRYLVKWGLDIWFICFVFMRRRILPGNRPDPEKAYIFVANHISYIDALLLFHAIRQPMRVLAKAELGKFPVWGTIYRMATVLVNRESPEARAGSVMQLKSVLSKKISIVLFPEGTFNMTDQPLKEFYDGAFRIAIETQTPIKPLLFLDTYDRVRPGGILITPGRCRMVYLPEISAAGLTMEDIPLLKQRVYEAMEEALIGYKVSWIKA